MPTRTYVCTYVYTYVCMYVCRYVHVRTYMFNLLGTKVSKKFEQFDAA